MTTDELLIRGHHRRFFHGHRLAVVCRFPGVAPLITPHSLTRTHTARTMVELGNLDGSGPVKRERVEIAEVNNQVRAQSSQAFGPWPCRATRLRQPTNF